jgi:hypothetical protein
MLLYSCKLGYVVGTYISRTYAAGISPVVEHPVAELDGVVDVIMEQVLGDSAACLGVPHPEHILLRRPRPAVRRRAAGWRQRRWGRARSPPLRRRCSSAGCMNTSIETSNAYTQ